MKYIWQGFTNTRFHTPMSEPKKMVQRPETHKIPKEHIIYVSGINSVLYTLAPTRFGNHAHTKKTLINWQHFVI